MTHINLNYYPGRYDSSSPVYGLRAEQRKDLLLQIKNSPVLGEFEVALHGEQEHSIDHLYIIPLKQREEADRASRKIFSKYIAPYESKGVTLENAVEWVPGDLWSGVYGSSPGLTIRRSQDRKAGLFDRHLHAVVKRDGKISKEGKGYLPAFVIAYHEFQHVEEGSEEDYMESQDVNYSLRYKL